MSNEASVWKLAIAGLQNAGKSSIVKTLQKKYQIGDSLDPTKNIDRNLFKMFGQDIAIWDFGGQAQYRKNYMANPERYFSMLKHFFYVIDIQDPSNFDSSVAYFEEIANFIIKEGSSPLVSVFFHKMDPEVKQKDEIKDRVADLHTRFRKIGEGLEIGFFETTCFDPLTVLTALSLPLLGATPFYNYMSAMFANFAMVREIEYMNIVVDGMFEVGSFRLIKDAQKFLPASVNFYTQTTKQSINKIPEEYNSDGYHFMAVSGEYEK